MLQLPKTKKLAYAMGGLAMSLTDLVVMQWLFVRYVPDKTNALVPAAWFGLFFFSGRILEAVANPIVGFWSDNFQSSRGRRIPFVRSGMVPLALIFFLLYSPPLDHPHWINALYAFLMIHLYFLAYTVVVTPYLALIPEITSDLAERVNITTLQAVFIMIATVLFATAGSILEAWGWFALAGIVALVTVLALLPLTLTIREKKTAPDQTNQKPRFLHGLSTTLQNRPFRYVVLSTSLFWFGLNSILMLVPFWVTSYLRSAENTVTMLMLPFLAMNLLSFFLFNYLAKRYGKYRMFLVTLLGSGLCFAAICIVGHLPFGTPFLQSAFLFALIGVPVAGFAVLPFAILSDVIDYDEQRTGRRREAMYFGVQAVFQKAAIGLSVLAFSVLAYVGSQSAASVTGLKLVALVAGAACAVGFLIFLRYPIRERDGKAFLLQ